MGAVLDTHVDALSRLPGPAESGFHDRFGRPDEGDDRTVGRLAGIHIQDLHTRDRCDGRDDPVNHFRTASLAEIGDAFNQSFHFPLTIWRA